MITLFVTVQVSTSGKLWGGMIAIDIAQVFVFIASIAVIFTFEGFVDLGSEVLCINRSLFILSAYLSCSFKLQSKYIFPLCRCSLYNCSFFVRAASVATLQENYHEIYSA